MFNYEKSQINYFNPNPTMLVHLGTCKCDSDYIGADCSQTLSTRIHTSEPPPPQVSALTNFGLCDTRTKPCRELTVLGDGLVNHEALKCNLEIYKVSWMYSCGFDLGLLKNENWIHIDYTVSGKVVRVSNQTATLRTHGSIFDGDWF